MANRIELDDKVVEKVNGGSIGFNPDDYGTYTMLCEFTRNTYYGVKLADIIEIGKFAASQPNTLEGEIEIINFAMAQGYIGGTSTATLTLEP